jgi:hypothetical protein
MGKEKTFMGINPDHKGYCTPMSKPTCTPSRKALAKRLKPGGDLYKGKTMKKKQQGGPLKQLNDMQYARRGKAVGSILEGGRVKYNEGGPYQEPINIQAPTHDLKGRRLPQNMDSYISSMKLKESGLHKKPSFAKGAIKARLRETKNDSLFGNQPLEKGSAEHKALKKVFKEEKKKGTYSRKAYKDKYK